MDDTHTINGMPKAWVHDWTNPKAPDPQVTRAPIPMPMADFHPLAYDYHPPRMGLWQRVKAWWL